MWEDGRMSRVLSIQGLFMYILQFPKVLIYPLMRPNGSKIQLQEYYCDTSQNVKKDRFPAAAYHFIPSPGASSLLVAKLPSLHPGLWC